MQNVQMCKTDSSNRVKIKNKAKIVKCKVTKGY